MSQNKNKIIKLFVGNLYNSAVHTILEKSINDGEIKSRYNKELRNSFDIANIYRQKLNPGNQLLSAKDAEIIRKMTITRVNVELNLRISKGYKDIDISLVEATVDDLLKKTNVI